MQGEQGSLFAAAPAPTIPSMGKEWTNEQLRGITTVGHSLLVSAAAGSGKTSVLAERCVFLVCDAKEPCDVDELLVVTFTEAAAAEMKGRIQEALRKRAYEKPSQRLTRQLALVDRAHVSTLHAFCSRVLRQHFHRVDLDPTFSVLDGEEAKLLRREVARKVIDDRFERDDEGLFARLVDYYGDGDDGRIADHVIRVHEMLTSVRDPQAWSTRAIQRIEEAIAGPLEETTLGRELIGRVEKGLAALLVRCEQTIQYIQRLGGFPKYIELLQRDARGIEHWQNILRQDGLDALAGMMPEGVDRLPAISNSVPNKEAAKDAIDAFRDALKEGRWREPLAFSPAEWTQGLEDVLPFARLFLDVVQNFTSFYGREKESARTVDFADLERLALKALTEAGAPSPVAISYRHQFKHVLVDEYQDINEVQDAILALVSRDGIPHGKKGKTPAVAPSLDANLFCVGDVKQSIYRFRLAAPERFLDRQRSYEMDSSHSVGESIDLQSNFRSRPALLNAINSVFEHLMTGEAADIAYDDRHRLVPYLNFPPAPSGEENRYFPGSPIELVLLPSRPQASDFPSGEQSTPDGGDGADCTDSDADASELDRTDREAIVVVERVRELLGLLPGTKPKQVMERDPAAPGGMKARPIRRSDIVILLRAMKFKSDAFAEALHAAGIPVYSESGSGFFAATEIRDMLALLSLLDNQRQDFPLAATLRGPLGKMPHPEDMLARIRLAFPEHGTPFHRAAERYAAERDDELAAHLRDFYARLAAWRFLSQRRPLRELIWTIYEESGFLTYVAGLTNGEQRVANLMALHERAAQFRAFHQQGLSRFLEFIQSLSTESETGQPSLASEGQDVVRIMSIHKSKGLEFPVVIVPDLGKKINLSDCGGSILADRVAGLGMMTVDPLRRVRYPSLASMLVQQRLRQQSLAEELRVLYVAMTRAKEHLILVGTADEKSKDQWLTRWRGHKGALPTESILGASTMLDWLGPVYAATGGDAGNVIRLSPYSGEEARALRDSSKSLAPSMQVQDTFARLEPLNPPPGPNALADDLIHRLTREYRSKPFSQIPASMAATAGKLHPVAQADDAVTLDYAISANVSRGLPMPAFLSGHMEPAADEIGTVMHLVLEHLNYSGPCDAQDIQNQIEALVLRKLMTPEQSGWVNVPALIWFANSELGYRIRKHPSKLLREIPLYLARSPDVVVSGLATTDPSDQIMIRGRIDALLNLDDGVILIDYKTDRVSKDEVIARAEVYRPQLEAYSSALQQMTGKSVAATYLVFLTPRILHTL